MSNIFEKIIDKHVDAFKEAISLDIRKMLSGETMTEAPKRRGRPAGKTAGKTAGKAKKAAKAPKAARKPRAPSEDTLAAVNDVVAAVVANDGMKSAEIIKKTGLDKSTVIKALKSAINSGKISKTGETRSTTYHAAATAAE